MISIAITKKVVTKGIIKVNHSQWVIIAKANAAVEIKNNSQYSPLDFLFTSILKSFRKNRGDQINRLIIINSVSAFIPDITLVHSQPNVCSPHN